MWYPCGCPECDAIESHNLRNTTWITNEMGSFPVIHGFLPLTNGGGGGGERGGYPMPHMGGLRRSATCGIVTGSHFYPSKGAAENELPGPPQLINGRLTICDGKVHPADDDDDDIAKTKLSLHDGASRSVKGSKEAPDDLFQEGFKKSRDYSDDSLTPDSTLPAVIRRRNRNRRKKLAVSMTSSKAHSRSCSSDRSPDFPPFHKCLRFLTSHFTPFYHPLFYSSSQQHLHHRDPTKSSSNHQTRDPHHHHPSFPISFPF